MPTASRKRAASKRGRGRPARLSREAILEAALALIERSPEEPLTLSRVAVEVDAVPAALYRHVGSHDELLDGVLGLVLDGIRFEIRRRASPRAQVHDWMICVRSHLLRYPAVVAMIGRSGRTSPAWFDASDVLVEILERAGLRGRELAHAYLWITEVTMGCVVNEATLSYADQVEGARNALSELTNETRERHAPLVRQLASLDSEAFFGLMAERTLAAIPELAGPTARKPGR